MLDFKAHKYTQGHPYNLMTNKGKKTIVYISVVVLLTYEVNINQVWLKRNVFTYAPESNCYGSYQTPELQKKKDRFYLHSSLKVETVFASLASAQKNMNTWPVPYQHHH